LGIIKNGNMRCKRLIKPIKQRFLYKLCAAGVDFFILIYKYAERLKYGRQVNRLILKI